MPTDAVPLFDAEHAEFMQGGISMNAAACGADLTPSVGKIRRPRRP
ncbi:MAG: hypothetical protein JWP34_2390 [Massilia sp.]|jgi:hypothetical protein|nr:hypothetical protein [Massilia sp.]